MTSADVSLRPFQHNVCWRIWQAQNRTRSTRDERPHRSSGRPYGEREIFARGVVGVVQCRQGLFIGQRWYGRRGSAKPIESIHSSGWTIGPTKDVSPICHAYGVRGAIRPICFIAKGGAAALLAEARFINFDNRLAVGRSAFGRPVTRNWSPIHIFHSPPARSSQAL